MKKTGWIELRATGPAPLIDAAASILVEAGSPGVVDEDATLPPELLISHGSPKEARPKKSKNAQGALRAYFSKSASLDIQFLKTLSDNLKPLKWQFTVSPYKETDWREKWKAGIRPIRVIAAETSVIVKPTWRKIKKKRSDVVVEIDPGMAFGTGSHETTKTCLKTMITAIKKDCLGLKKLRLLDVGTGSGVLAIAAVKLGATSATGTDIDPEAIKVAKENAKLNKTKIRFSASPLEAVKGSFEIVVANIISRELKKLSPLLASRVARNGRLILSGILVEEAGAVKKVFIKQGLAPIARHDLNEWTTLVFAGKPI